MNSNIIQTLIRSAKCRYSQKLFECFLLFLLFVTEHVHLNTLIVREQSSNLLNLIRCRRIAIIHIE